ncbi:MAG TPA: prolyl oligopeptidase family serine peptidase [Pyrinomonadaceae bacterium]|nr:prolyl oligopeptidase family serine peptidase [Pyrinomonadaceae bacterium]
MSRETRDAPEWRLLRCFANQCKGDQLAAASPISYLDVSDPPILLIVGDTDVVVPTRQTLEMADKRSK